MRTLILPLALIGSFLCTTIAVGQDVNEIIEQFEDIDDMTLSAGVEVVVTEGCNVGESVATDDIIPGMIDYYANGAHWRVNSSMDPARYGGMDTEISWNGSQFQYLRNDTSVLDITTGIEPADTGMALPNPLFELLSFLEPVPNHARQLRLTDVKHKAGTTSLANTEWTAVQRDGRTLNRAVFTGGTTEDGVAYEHRLYVRPERPGRPVEIERVDAQGNVLTHFRFDGWDRFVTGDDAVMYWPRSVQMQIRNPATGEACIEMTFSIRGITVNDDTQVPASIFTLPWDQAVIVAVDGIIVQP